MPDNFSKIFGGRGSGQPERATGSSLPPTGSVVMATVEEDLGEGMYSLRWAGNRVAVSSKVALRAGETLILKSELSGEGKPVLVVQGPALPNATEQLVRSTYGPVYKKPAENGATGQVAASSTPAASPGSPEPGTTLKPILQQLPDAELFGKELLLAAEEETAKVAESRDKAAQNDGKAEQSAEKQNQAEGKQPEGASRPEARPAAGGSPDAQAGDKSPQAQPSRPAEGQVPSEAKPEGARQPSGNPATAEARPLPAESSTPTAKPPDGQPPSEARPAQPQEGQAGGEAGSNASRPTSDGSTAAPPTTRPAEGQAPVETGPAAPPQGGTPAAPGQDVGSSQQQPAQPQTPPAVTPPSSGAPGSADAIPLPTAPGGQPQLPETPSANVPSAPPTAQPVPLPGTVEGSGAVTVPGAATPPADAASGASSSLLSSMPAVAEALEQIANASQLPLGAVASPRPSGGAVPEAIADKAASILLNAAGLSPGPASLDAAKALLRHNVQIDRQTVQTLMALSAGHGEAERASVMNAAARLVSHDVPLAAPLVGGLSDILGRNAGIADLLSETMASLSIDEAPVQARPLLDAAKQMLDILVVDLEQADAPLALERFVSTFGREALGKALALVETATQTVLENHSQLPRIDQALTAILAALEDGEAAPAAQPVSTQPTPTGGQPAQPAPLPGQSMQSPSSQGTQTQTPSLPEQSGQAQVPPLQGQPAPAQAGTTPMPGGEPSAQAQARPSPEAAQPPDSALSRGQRETPQPGANEGMAPGSKESTGGTTDNVAKLLSGTVLARAGNQILATGFQLPGVNAADVELLRPMGVLDRFVARGEAREIGEVLRRQADQLVRNLLSDDPQKTEAALRDLKSAERPLLRAAVARLSEMEREAIRNDPVLNRLSDAAGSLRDLGRQMLAAKAENLSGFDRNPGVMLAEVPFKLADQSGDGRMQMFYRRSGDRKGGWSARVILDLNTTNMGPVLGDMRFFGQDMVLNLFVEDAGTAAFLADAADELAEALLGKGFRLKPKFLVLPPPPPPPEIEAARPEIAGEGKREEENREEPGAGPTTGPGTGPVRRRLDAKA